MTSSECSALIRKRVCGLKVGERPLPQGSPGTLRPQAFLGSDPRFDESDLIPSLAQVPFGPMYAVPTLPPVMDNDPNSAHYGSNYGSEDQGNQFAVQSNHSH